MATARARAFFDAQPDVTPCAEGYRYRSCTIRLTPLATQSDHPFALPRTQLVIDGPEAEVRALHRRFFLRFLSAGG